MLFFGSQQINLEEIWRILWIYEAHFPLRFSQNL